MRIYFDDWSFAVAYKNGDDGDGEQDSETGDADWAQGQWRVPSHVLHVQVVTAPLVVIRPAARTAIGALELVLDVLPRIASVAAPAARVALNNEQKID